MRRHLKGWPRASLFFALNFNGCAPHHLKIDPNSTKSFTTSLVQSDSEIFVPKGDVMRIFMKLAFAVLALMAVGLPGASSDAAVTQQTLPAIDSAAGEKPLLQEVSKKRRFWGKRLGSKRFSHKWRHKKHFKNRFRKRFHRRPSIYLRLRPYPRYYYYDDYYDDDVYYSSSCGTYEEKKLCARRFKSFDWDTCRYTTYSGHKRLCPYVS
jgi:hypothetical protein